MTKISLEHLILYKMREVSSPLTEEEYQLVGLGKWNYFKRKKFSNIYKTLMLYLVKLSTPEAFKENSKDVLTGIDKFLDIAYINKKGLYDSIKQDLDKLSSLTETGETRFDKLAWYIAEQFEGKKAKQVVYMVNLKLRMQDMYGMSVAKGKEIEIVEDLKTKGGKKL